MASISKPREEQTSGDHRGNTGGFLDLYATCQSSNTQLTMLPEHWEALQQQWEYSHATSAGLNLIALMALILSMLTRKGMG
jgi:hypothetical protein